jgi:hypothetical protein
MPAARARRTDDVEAQSRPRTRSDVYVGLLLVALIAQLAGILFLYLDFSAYPDKAPPPAARPPALVPSGPVGGQQGGAPPAGAQGVPAGGGRGAQPGGVRP